MVLRTLVDPPQTFESPANSDRWDHAILSKMTFQESSIGTIRCIL